MNWRLKHLKQFCFFAGIILTMVVVVLALSGKLFSASKTLAQEIAAPETAAPETLSVYKLSGWLWSYNIGWVELAKVYADAETGKLAGYGWSYNIGWIDFAPIGPYPEEPQNAAKIDFTAVAESGISGKINGWLRAINGLRDDNGGWDGWIKLDNVKIKNTPITNGWLLNKAAAVSNKKQLSGFAWGSGNVGWLDWSGADIEFTEISGPEWKEVFEPKPYPSGGSSGDASGGETGTVEPIPSAGETAGEEPAVSEPGGIIESILKLFQPRKEVAPQ